MPKETLLRRVTISENARKGYYMRRYGNLDRMNPDFVKPRQVRSKHRWTKENTCLYCGVARERRNWKRLMAMDLGQRQYFQYGQEWVYSFNSFKTETSERPDCIHNPVK